MKQPLLKSLMALTAVCAVPSAVQAQVLISGYNANPTGTDSPYEYVQLIAYDAVDFSFTPMSVVFANNGNGNANGWAAGGALTFKFDLTTGSVGAGEVFYVGGSGKTINGSGSTSLASEKWIRSIDTSSAGSGGSGGDGFGSGSNSGVLGNGTGNADGIAIFIGTSINSSSVPLDALFFGSGTGGAVVSGGSEGYELPSNDFYSGGKLQSGSSILSDPANGGFTQLTGTFDLNTSTWGIGRTASNVQSPTQISDIETSIGFTGVLVPEPTTAMLGLIGAGALVLRGRRRN